MGIMMPETCWVNLKWINIFTCVICCFFLLPRKTNYVIVFTWSCFFMLQFGKGFQPGGFPFVCAPGTNDLVNIKLNHLVLEKYGYNMNSIKKKSCYFLYNIPALLQRPVVRCGLQKFRCSCSESCSIIYRFTARIKCRDFGV